MAMHGSIKEKSGSAPLAASTSNWANGTKWVAKRPRSREKWISPVADSGIGSDTYTFQVLPYSSSRLKIVSASLLVSHFIGGLFRVKPDEVAAVQNDRFIKVWDGTSQNQWSNT